MDDGTFRQADSLSGLRLDYFPRIPLALIYELAKEITYVWDRLEQTLSSDNQLLHFLLLE